VFKFPLAAKLGITALVMFILFIPLSMIRDVIAERAGFRAQALDEVSRAHAGAQTVTGPVLHLPYTETYTVQVPVAGSPGATVPEIRNIDGVSIQFPRTLNVDGDLSTEVRYRGIFPVTVYTSRQQIRGRLAIDPIKPAHKEGRITLGQPSLLVGVSDLRGLRSAPRLSVQGRELTVTPLPAGLNAPLPLAATLPAEWAQAGTEMDYTLDLDLAGTARIAWVPLAVENTVHLASGWPHPSFSGNVLPRDRTVTEHGFDATWSVPALSSQAQQQFLSPQARAIAGESFGVDLSDPADVYRLSERAAKYGLMFVLLTFAAFLVVEVLGRSRIHPMQYLMVGMAMVLFFLLLLSLAEHLPFWLAYLSAGIACIALIAYYLSRVLGSARAGAGMGAMLTALYGVLYGILVSEDNALMLGSLLLFGVLAAMMVATRRLDWYAVLPAAAAGSAPKVAVEEA
jgi:inner membrane protein